MYDNEGWTIVAVTVACIFVMLHLIVHFNFLDSPVQGNELDDNPNMLNVDGVWGNLNDFQNEEQVSTKTRPNITNKLDGKLTLE